MCGRFSLIGKLEDIAAHFEAHFADDLEFSDRYNITPSQMVLSVINDGYTNRIGKLKWGLVPSWSKDPKVGHKLFNARGESIHEKPSFRSSFKRRRCIIPASNFFEWRKHDRQPFNIHLKNNKFMAFAGLWDRWEKDGETIHSCTIVTTDANEHMSSMHHRMPVIFSAADCEAWLDRTSDTERLKSLLVPYSGELTTYEISTQVNSPKNEKAEILNPL